MREFFHLDKLENGMVYFVRSCTGNGLENWNLNESAFEPQQRTETAVCYIGSA